MLDTLKAGGILGRDRKDSFVVRRILTTDPLARSTFGIYKGNSHIIYIREVY
jgi:hypothetical protein